MDPNPPPNPSPPPIVDGPTLDGVDDSNEERGMYVRPGDPGYPDVESLIIEDGKPVDSQYSEKQMRLLTEPLYSTWDPGRTFIAMANVGLFMVAKNPAIVPDMLLSMDIETRTDMTKKENLSYFVWDRGKIPEVVIEIVSRSPGGEDSDKMARYQRMRIPHYVIWDPAGLLNPIPFRYFHFEGGKYVLQELTQPLSEVGLSLGVWNGKYEDCNDQWLRWQYPDGRWVATGQEAAKRSGEDADRAQANADRAQARAEKLEALLRSHGIDPPSENGTAL